MAYNTAAVVTCVPDDVIQHHQPLELELELTVVVFRQRLGFKPPQPEIRIFITVYEELEGADLKRKHRQSDR